MRVFIYVVLLQISIFFLIVVGSVDKVSDDTYLAKGLKLNVDEKTMDLLQNNIYWIKAFTNNEDNPYWIDKFHNPKEKVFYCSQYSTDSSCIQYIKKVISKCDYSKFGSIYWTYRDGVFMQWKLSKEMLVKKLNSCGISIIGKVEKLNTSTTSVNNIFVALLFILISSIPFIVNKKQRR